MTAEQAINLFTQLMNQTRLLPAEVDQLRTAINVLTKLVEAQKAPKPKVV